MSDNPPRIALIHALAHSMAPVNAEFERRWPGCTRMNLLDDSLAGDLAAGRGRLDERMTQRFVDLTAYAISTGVRGVLFTCSAFGPCIEAVARRWPDLPILKPNEAMIADAVKRGRRIGLVATFRPTLEAMPPEFPQSVTVVPVLAEGAMAALNEGKGAVHDQFAVAAARRAAAAGCDVIALAQFSLARAAPAVAEAVGLPVLTTVESAVRLLRERVAGPDPAYRSN